MRSAETIVLKCTELLEATIDATVWNNLARNKVCCFVTLQGMQNNALLPGCLRNKTVREVAGGSSAMADYINKTYTLR